MSAFACASKSTYPDRTTAERYISSQGKKQQSIHVYQCPACGLWHQTRRTPEEIAAFDPVAFAQFDAERREHNAPKQKRFSAMPFGRPRIVMSGHLAG